MDIEPNGHWQGESQSYSQNSQSVAIHNEAGDIEHCAGVFRDISTQTHKICNGHQQNMQICEMDTIGIVMHITYAHLDLGYLIGESPFQKLHNPNNIVARVSYVNFSPK